MNRSRDRNVLLFISIYLMKPDISNRTDIDELLRVFYNTLLADDSINYIFTDVMKVDMKAHLPVIGDFWENILLDANIYRKNVMQLHLEIHDQTPLLKHHFSTWLHHFKSTVDELFEGPVAFKAKERALSIATMMQVKIAQK